jgi:DNA polymerase III subunit delta'
MALLNGIKGQDNALRYLKSSVEKGRMAASYLFSGPRGVGRALCARTFIKSLVCAETRSGGKADCACPACLRIDSDEHPDVRWMIPERNKKIKIEDIRAVKDMLSLKPFEAPVSVAVIEDAHMMTVEASNALLKVLEEPPGEAMIILISDKKELLLPTVISRCSEVRFMPLSVSLTKDILMESSGMDLETAAFLSFFSQGSPGLALEMAERGLLERKEKLAGMVSAIFSEDIPFCPDLEGRDRDGLIEDIDTLIMLLRDVVFEKEGMGDMALDEGSTQRYGDIMPNKGTGGIYRIVAALVDMKLAIAGNINPKLAAQALPGVIGNS